MKNKKTQIESGERGRYSGYKFEDIIRDEMNRKTKIGEKIIKYILMSENIFPCKEFSYKAYKTPSKVKNVITGNNDASPKADVILEIEVDGSYCIRKGISIKSSPNSVQVQITNVDSFKRTCEYYGIKMDEKTYVGLCKFCGWGEYKPSEEEKKKLKQGRRDRWLFNELEEEEQKAIKDFFTTNAKEIVEIILKKGNASVTYYADYYLVNLEEYSSTRKIDICMKSIEEIIESSIGAFKPTKRGSFHLGKITIQMKGSGKGKRYHDLQFNKKGC